MTHLLPFAGLLAMAAAPTGELFEKPVRLEVEGAPIDGQVGHLAPWVHDWDGDGVRDLLVGQFGGGKLAIYLNKGTTAGRGTSPRAGSRPAA